METGRRLRGGGSPQPHSQPRPLLPPLSLYPSTSSSAAQSSLPLNRVHPSNHSYSHSHQAHDAPSPPLTPSSPSQPPQLRPESWQSGTQDSVLDNLLLSFDRMMPASAAGPAEHRPSMPDIHSDGFDTSSTTFTPPRGLKHLQQRVRGHTYSSSASHDSDTISNTSQLTARIRTNSHSDSRPSTVQSLDYGYGQVLGTTRIGAHDKSDPRTQGTPEVVSNGILDRGRPIPSMFSTYEAHCPEPRVPGGPSKSNTTKEPASTNNSDIPQSIRDQALEFVRQSNMRAQSPVNMLEQPPTNSSASIASSLSKQSSAHDAPKERPGFFRRVFGSSTRTNSFPEQQRPTIRDRPAHSVETTAPPAVPAKIQANFTDPPQPQNVITKKASFFRRRKKSMTDVPPPLPLPNPVVSASHLQDQTQPVSPGASSLRMVMDRYLGDSDRQLNKTDSNQSKPVDTPVSRPTRTSILSHDTDESSELDMFHSGYTPPPDASIRRVGVEPLEPRAGGIRAVTSNSQQKAFTSPKLDDMERNFGGVNERLQTGVSRPKLAQSNSFLSDKSDANDSQAPSIISAVSETYVEPPGTFSPVSPIATPTERFVTSPTSDLEREPVSPRSHFFEHNRDSLGLPLEGVKEPQSYVVSNDDSDLPSFQVDGHTVRPSVEVARGMLGTIEEPTADERERARQIYQGEEQELLKDEAAPWLGDKNPVSARTLTAYMDLYDFANRNILSGLRTLCDRLVLKGESQQVDRILDAFSRRWDECNTHNGFKGPGVVHAICYALLLLNTDQHMADIQHKMTRSEFIKNTMPAIKSAAESATIRPSRSQRPSLPWSDTTPKSPDDDDRSSIDFRRSTKRLSFRPGMGRFETDPGPGDNAEFGSMNHMVNRPFDGPEHKWLTEVESVLKAFYNSIVSLALPLHGSQKTKEQPGSSHSPANLAVGGNLRRTGSIISKAPSEGFSYRSKRNNSALSSHWNATNNRSKQKVYPASTVGSTRTSIDDGRSVWSPSAQSSMWSKISMGRTQTTMSVESFAVHPDFKQSLGFTNALSQAIIREEGAGDTESVMKIGTVLEDESLELAGAPWAKEGMVKHKHHLDGPEKKAKERSWSETFAVVEKGYLHLFNFNRTTTKINDMRSNKRQLSKTGKAANVAPSVVGGGNWTDNADETDQFLLRQSLATVLPHPGYSKTRPHVWALSLPTGAVHLFHVGTAEIAEEFASTVNYWSARLSKEPLVGGVDNIEYGWSDNIINPALVGNSNGEPLTKPPSRAGGSHAYSASVNSVGKQSMQSTVRGSFDQTFGSRSRLPGDRAHIADWKPPAASMLPSQLLEIDQLRSLKAYVASVESELERHNELRSAVNIAYTNHHGQNWNKVTANWEKKSAYLLREVVKFRTYIEALERAGREKEKVYEERLIREQERAALGSKDGKKENIKA
ncbi:SEC7-like protein, partial [Aureobasidium melanogenum]